MIKTNQLTPTNYWISVTAPTAHERSLLSQRYHVAPSLLDYALDPYEKARIEKDETAGITLFIFDIVLPQHKLSEPDTTPVGLMLTPSHLITFTTDTTDFANVLIARQIEKMVATRQGHDNLDLLIRIMYKFTTAYFDPIRQADIERMRIQRNLQQTMNRSAISSLMTIETGLVYILSSLQGNIALLQEFDRRYQKKMTEAQSEALDDVLVEAQQGLEMAQMASTLTQRVSDAYSKVLDSNLNQTMKFLTVYSIILAIPPIVSGFYGENVKLPLADTDWAWQLTIVITLIMILISIWFILNKHWWR